MNRIRMTVARLKKYGRFSWVVWDLINMVAFTVFGLYFEISGTPLLAVLFFMLAGWEISDVKLYEDMDSYKAQLEDKDDDVVVLKGKVMGLEDELSICRDLLDSKKENPIKSNRIVADKTFAIRLRGFVEGVKVCDAASYEEKDYLLDVSNRLLTWQTRTVRKDTGEYRYLERLGLMPELPANVQEHTDPMPKKRKKASQPGKQKQKANVNEVKD